MKDKDQQFVAMLLGAKRMNNSPSGSPRWRLLVEGAGSLYTQHDSQINNQVEARCGVREGSWVGKPVRFTATKAGRIIGWELAESGD